MFDYGSITPILYITLDGTALLRNFTAIVTLRSTRLNQQIE
jgi:hypothetical protein